MKPNAIISAITVAAAMGFSSMAIADHGDAVFNPNVRKTQINSPAVPSDTAAPGARTAGTPSLGDKGAAVGTATREVNGAQPKSSVRTSGYQRDDMLNVPGNPAFGRINTP